MQHTNRSRNRNDYSTLYVSKKDKDWAPTVTFYPYGEVTFKGSIDSIDDVYSSTFYERKKRGEIVLNDLYIRRDFRSCETASLDYAFVSSNNWGPRLVTGDVSLILFDGYTLPNREVDIESAKEQVLIQAYAKMKEPPIQGLPFLGELDMTLKMLKKPLAGIQAHLRKMRKARKVLTYDPKFIKDPIKRKALEQRLLALPSSRKKSQISATVATWLEFRYGWKPLMMDIESVIKEIDRKRPKSKRRLVARSTVKFDFDLEDEVNIVPDYASCGFQSADCEVSGKDSTHVHGGVIYDRVDENLYQYLMAVAGLRTRDIPGAVWELLPYSFVWDWFFNFGQWLQAVIPDSSVTPLGHWTSRVSKRNIVFKAMNCNLTVVSSGGNVVYEPYGGAAEIEQFAMERNVNQPLAILPDWKVTNLTSLQSLDGIALLTQSILGSIRNYHH